MKLLVHAPVHTYLITLLNRINNILCLAILQELNFHNFLEMGEAQVQVIQANKFRNMVIPI